MRSTFAAAILVLQLGAPALAQGAPGWLAAFSGSYVPAFDTYDSGNGYSYTITFVPWASLVMQDNSGGRYTIASAFTGFTTTPDATCGGGARYVCARLGAGDD